MITPPDDRAPWVRAYDWAARGITVAGSMVVPGLIGYYLDTRWGTRPWIMMVGFAAGVALGIVQLVRMTREQ
ncbi:MAG: AtpZ/AtpI family protein [Pirellulaceae bacterium]|jgi:F0F1-type ATP synthase assembly protein I|nr:AtpZ/AtpI family protein [Pirellulaceae bacterium]